MAHIVDFEIKGLAGRTDTVKIKLDRHLNIFFGPNGCGKTSMLRILHSAMSNDGNLLKKVPFIAAKVTVHSLKFNENFLHVALNKNRLPAKKGIRHSEESEQYLLLDDFSDSSELTRYTEDPEFIWNVKGHPKKTHGSWKHKYLSTWRLLEFALERGLSRRESSRSSIELELERIFAKRLEYLWTMYTNDFLVEIEKTQGKGLENVLKTTLSTRGQSPDRLLKLKPEVAYSQVSKFLERQGSKKTAKDTLGTLKNFTTMFKKDKKMRRVVADIYAVELSIEKASAPRSNFQKLIDQMFSGNKQIELLEGAIAVLSKDSGNIGIESLSSGEKHILQLFIEVLSAGKSTIILDEPEISLHVDWQRKLVSSMQLLNPNTQLIIATHSPEILAEIPDKYIHRL